MFYYKRNNCLFALKSEPKKIIEKDGKKKAVFDDSYTQITKEEFETERNKKLHKHK